ncbi:hypothetical protein AB4Y63_11960 [Leifsonia sp. YAF41]|uniref:hypothetical protein n=1 Tax=Leifsonia sp. YAF41 TaxID=3233086 RepID=UPI003F9C67E0
MSDPMNENPPDEEEGTTPERNRAEEMKGDALGNPIPDLDEVGDGPEGTDDDFDDEDDES